MANHEENEWEFKGERYTVKRGQMITSLESIAAKAGKGVTTQNIRTALKRFEKYGFLTSESTNKNRLITLINYGVYQHDKDEPNKQPNKQLTSNQQATNKQLTTNNNVNNYNNDNNEIRLKHSSRKYDISDMETSTLFYSLILENNPNFKKPNLESWANEIRLMRERDKRTIEQINYLVEWVQKDSFWQSNILSPKKLREKFDQLAMKVKSEIQKNNQRIEKKQGKPRAFSSLEQWAEE